MTGAFGKGMIKDQDGTSAVRLVLRPEESLVLEIHSNNLSTQPYHFYHEQGTPVPLTETWTIRFSEGGPTLPEPVTGDSLNSWTEFGPDYANFSGTATYSTSFPRPATSATHWRLELGEVHESAEVWLNGVSLGTLIGGNFGVAVQKEWLKDQNELTVKVSNLMANRIADLDRQHVFWRKFYNVNFPARKPENRKNGLFDASSWSPRISGLLGPVRLVAQEPVTE
jgi:hypothetical protein